LPFLTITTDFGTKDGFVGTMKGVIWKICPEVQIADITHEVAPQNVHEGAIALWRAYSFFPAGTVHVAVVDPGVGTQRRAIAAKLGDQYFVAPDNGLLTPIIEDTEAKGLPMTFVHLTNQTFWLQDVSHTFHGRDIFAPVGAYLAKGVSLKELGPFITDVKRTPLPRPEKTVTGYKAQIAVVDVFGNLTTNLPVSAVEAFSKVTFHLKGAEIKGLVASYGHRKPGDLVALGDSEGFIEIAVVNGSGAKTLGAGVGDEVEVILER
jgi:S-adenosyl-L-methionine hydrolase (adenosine-forming)